MIDESVVSLQFHSTFCPNINTNALQKKRENLKPINYADWQLKLLWFVHQNYPSNSLANSLSGFGSRISLLICSVYTNKNV